MVESNLVVTYTTGGLVIEKRTSDPVSPEDAQLWLRTDIPPPPSASGKNFFLLSYGTYDGNLLGYAQTTLGYTGTNPLQAADKICKAEVNAHDFIGKPPSRIYTDAEVYAFLCAEVQGTATCRNLLPTTTYVMGRLGTTTHGGQTFTTNSAGSGPGDRSNWSSPQALDAAAVYWTYRLNLGTETNWVTTAQSGMSQCGTTSWTRGDLSLGLTGIIKCH